MDMITDMEGMDRHGWHGRNGRHAWNGRHGRHAWNGWHGLLIQPHKRIHSTTATRWRHADDQHTESPTNSVACKEQKQWQYKPLEDRMISFKPS